MLVINTKTPSIKPSCPLIKYRCCLWNKTSLDSATVEARENWEVFHVLAFWVWLETVGQRAPPPPGSWVDLEKGHVFCPQKVERKG